jgi:hypothetical protein
MHEQLTLNFSLYGFGSTLSSGLGNFPSDDMSRVVDRTKQSLSERLYLKAPTMIYSSIRIKSIVNTVTVTHGCLYLVQYIV